MKTYQRHLPAQERQVSKLKMQKIERKHLTLQTIIKRLSRRSICFSFAEQKYDEMVFHFLNLKTF
ncbi:IS1 family transposase [Mastigocoleus sp. MO_188.B34]|uniref:IS1 family transposase n=1 Tax=Mastigocoleus sp. MO_188.B34 TaxID=3036635 RepID=UPI00345301F6